MQDWDLDDRDGTVTFDDLMLELQDRCVGDVKLSVWFCSNILCSH